MKIKFIFVAFLILIFTGCTFYPKAPYHTNQEVPARQLLIVIADTSEQNHAKLWTYEETDTGWNMIHGPFYAEIGRKGLQKTKEGDKKSPSGKYALPFAFGTEKKPKELKIPYYRTDQYDYWVDDVNSPDYNCLVRTKENPKTYWKSFERMAIDPYKYGMLIDYNPEAVPGKGSAIFFHLESEDRIGTSGCTGTSEENILKIFNWIDIGKNPHIIQGTRDEINVFLPQTIENELNR